LQEKVVAWDRRQAASALALPAGAPLDPVQRHHIRTLGASVFALGQILMEQGSPDCVAAYEETIRYMQRIQDTAAEAGAHFNLGHAYKDIPAIRDLGAAEAAYQRSLELMNPNDSTKRAVALQQIGMVHHERFDEARRRGEPAETVLGHARAAKGHYLQALALCPPTAVADLGPMHAQTANLYAQVGELNNAREHFEEAAQYFEQTGDRYRAGQTRFNMALMYLEAAGREGAGLAGALARRRDLLHRAQAYAGAALRDYQHYQGRAAADEAEAQRLLAHIAQALAELPG
jgi:tetratricopeptide (TPR) repeat protein